MNLSYELFFLCHKMFQKEIKATKKTTHKKELPYLRI